jgi:hypothetical protein
MKMDDKHLLKLAKEISEIIDRNRVYNANIITELHANENAHSRILRMFLQYDDGKKEYPILSKFLEIPKVKKIFGNKGVKNPVFSNEQERIDVLIEEPGSFAVIVENKIKGATDQERQLERYIESVNAHGVPYDNIYAIYLTDSGDKEVSDVSFTDVAKECLGYKDENDMGRFVPMNYRYDILPWLEKEVLPNCIEKEELLISALKQYIDYLKCMFGIIENEEQKTLIMEKLKKELDINGEDIFALDKYLKTIEELECLKNRVVELKKDLVVNWVEEYIKKPFEEYLNGIDPMYELVVKFDSFERFDIAVHYKGWEKFYFLVQKMGGTYYGIYNKEKSNPYKVKDNTFSGYATAPWWPAYKNDCSLVPLGESDFWRQVKNLAFVIHLKKMFEEVLKNI